MNYIVKISLDGFDVKTAAPENCAIHSMFPPMHAKLNQSIPHTATLHISFSGPISQGVDHIVYRVPHTYNYIPTTFTTIKASVGSLRLNGIGYTGVGATLSIGTYSNASYFIVSIFDSANWINSSSSIDISYYIFAENGT